jgi:hypothetical protein
MEQQVIDKLYDDLKIDQKPGQGFKYVKTRYVLDRLNKAFNCNWGLLIKEHKIIDDEILVLVTLNVYDDAGNVLAMQDGFGSAKKFRGIDLGNVSKSATSKAIKSAARNWGVGLFLEEEEEEDEVGSKTVIAPKIQMPSIGAASGVPTDMPGSITSVTTTVTNNSTPSSFPGSKPSVSNSKVEGKAPITMPKTNPYKKDNSGPSALPKMVATPGTTPVDSSTILSGGTTEDGEDHLLSMVQKVAINTRLSTKGITFEDAAKEFYTDRANPIPDSIDSMLYTDALDMVVFLNSK